VSPTYRSGFVSAVMATWLAASSGLVTDKPTGSVLWPGAWLGAASGDVGERILAGHRDNVYALAMAPDGQRLVSASEDGTARVWDWRSGKCLVSLEHDGPVYDAAFSPDGKLLATADGAEQVHIFDAISFRTLHMLRGHTGPVYALAFSPDGRWLATGGGEKDFTCRVWEVPTAKLAATLTGHHGAIYGVAFSSNGVLATSSEDGTVRLWNWQRQDSRVLRGHTSYVYRCRFSPDGRLLASVSHDRTVRLWDAEQGKLRETFGPFRQAVYAVAFENSGQYLACVGEEHRVCILPLSAPGKDASQACGCREEIPGPRDAVYAVFWLGGTKTGTLFYAGGDRKIIIRPR